MYKHITTVCLIQHSHRSLKESFCLVAPVCCLSTLLYIDFYSFSVTDGFQKHSAFPVTCDSKFLLNSGPFLLTITRIRDSIINLVVVSQTCQHWTFLNSAWCDLILSSSDMLPVIVALFRTMQRLTPLSCGAKLTQRVWRPSGRVQSMWYRCAHGLWLALANTAARCASKPSQMVRIAEPGETALLPSRSILLCLVCFVSCTIALFFFFFRRSCLCICCCIIISK